jgi:hypothetical protein
MTGNDFTRETVKHETLKVRFHQGSVQHKGIMIAYIKTIKKHHRYNNQAIRLISIRDYALGLHNVINIVTVAVGEIFRQIRIYV